MRLSGMVKPFMTLKTKWHGLIGNMKGNIINEFIVDLYFMDKLEKEFAFKDKHYFLWCEAVDSMIEMVMFQPCV